MFFADNFCTYTESFEGGKNFYIFSGMCKKTGKPYSVKVPGDGLYKYRQGAYIQDAFPDVSPGDREFLKTGYTPEAWGLIFPSDEDDEDGEGWT